jgi:hypothetical protein
MFILQTQIKLNFLIEKWKNVSTLHCHHPLCYQSTTQTFSFFFLLLAYCDDSNWNFHSPYFFHDERIFCNIKLLIFQSSDHHSVCYAKMKENDDNRIKATTIVGLKEQWTFRDFLLSWFSTTIQFNFSYHCNWLKPFVRWVEMSWALPLSVNEMDNEAKRMGKQR